MSGADRETVYVSGRQNGGGGKRKIHTDPQCPGLKGANTPLPRPRDTYPGEVDCCKICSGDIEQPETQDVSHYNALVASAEARCE